ncbi:hypothetical protein MG293_004301 [Ovis ammon polii]|uniref:Uncharacterized protein n=1 Tax=Ovis ammon polii TaxID=230172 RepID=A0AAD4UH70_OVIAM|nr:hypothetical protein MG293_004301 [Ovis ammon polii]
MEKKRENDAVLLVHFRRKMRESGHKMIRTESSAKLPTHVFQIKTDFKSIFDETLVTILLLKFKVYSVNVYQMHAMYQALECKRLVVSYGLALLDDDSGQGSSQVLTNPDWMLMPIALNQSSEELPGMLDVALLGVGSWEASVSFTGTTVEKKMKDKDIKIRTISP